MAINANYEEARIKREKYAQEKAAALKQFNADANDWEAKCPRCGKVLRGTLAQLKEHVCGE